MLQNKANILERTCNLLQQVKEVTAKLTEARDSAKQSAIEAIRTLESDLGDSLGGERLKGVFRLTPNGFPPFQGVHVRRTAKDAPLNDIPTLVLSSDGVLTVASFNNSGNDVSQFTQVRVAEDSDIILEDLEGLLTTLNYILPIHCRKAQEAQARFEQVDAFARKVLNCLDA